MPAESPQRPSLLRGLKPVADGLARACVLPLVMFVWLESYVLGPQQAFSGGSQLMSLFPGLVGTYLRRAFYWWCLPRCGHGACICFGTTFSHGTAEIGNYVYVGNFGVLGDVTLEDDVLIGSQVSIANGSQQHGTERLDIPVREQPGIWPRVTIGTDTWIGDRAVILADVGKHCVIGAGTVVTKPIPDYAVAVGVPARIVRYRNHREAEAPAEPVSCNDGNSQ